MNNKNNVLIINNNGVKDMAKAIKNSDKLLFDNEA